MTNPKKYFIMTKMCYISLHYDEIISIECANIYTCVWTHYGPYFLYVCKCAKEKSRL